MAHEEGQESGVHLASGGEDQAAFEVTAGDAPPDRPSVTATVRTGPPYRDQSELWKSDAQLENQITTERAGAKSWRTTAWLAYAAVGVALGDLGTSPIYTLSAVFTEPPGNDQVLGAASIIFWSLSLILVVKYQLIVLRLDDHGEGGTFALYSLLSRHLGIVPGLTDEVSSADRRLERFSVNPRLRRSEVTNLADRVRKWFQHSRAAQIGLLLVVVLMTSLVIGDGVLTPAQTVLGAFGAITVRAPSFPQSSVAGISMGVLAAIFMVQPLGTARIGFLYAPIVLLWFLFNIANGIHNIVVFYPAIFKVINPYYLYAFFRDDSRRAWEACAAIFLCLTGAEASYADLGHFNRPAIRIAFLGICYPTVILTYFGQAAWLLKNPEGFATSFFLSVPWNAGYFWTYFVLTVAAAIVASQTMVSAAFSVVKQSMALQCFPRMKVIHTSKQVPGQLWVPAVMVFMMVFTIAAVGIFQNSTALGFSYGVCVSTLMIGTDLLISLAMIVIWELPLFFPIAFFLVFGFIDVLFWTANLTKIPHGGWFAVTIAIAICAFSYIWLYGGWLKRQFQRTHKVRFFELLGGKDPATGALLEATSGVPDAPRKPLRRLPGIGLLYTDHVGEEWAPTVLEVFVKRLHALPETTVLIKIRQVPVSSVSPEERLLARTMPNFPDMFEVVARYGYQDKVSQGPDFMRDLLAELTALGKHFDDEQRSRITYTIMDTKLKGSSPGLSFNKYFVDWIFAPFAHLVSVKTSESWGIPHDALIELGIIMPL